MAALFPPPSSTAGGLSGRQWHAVRCRQDRTLQTRPCAADKTVRCRQDREGDHGPLTRVRWHLIFFRLRNFSSFFFGFFFRLAIFLHFSTAPASVSIFLRSPLSCISCVCVRECVLCIVYYISYTYIPYYILYTYVYIRRSNTHTNTHTHHHDIASTHELPTNVQLAEKKMSAPITSTA
jgi:hypothetical protein